MERSLTKTLAAKEQIPIPQVYRKYHATIMVEGRPYKGLQVTIEREWEEATDRAMGRHPSDVEYQGNP